MRPWATSGSEFWALRIQRDYNNAAYCRRSSHDHRVIKLGDTRDTSDPSVIHWRTSSFSGNNGTCVEVAALPDGHIAVRNSTIPTAPRSCHPR